MKYKVIMEKGNYALILRGLRMDEYAVVNGLNAERGDWAHTVTYYNFSAYSPINQAQALFYAVDNFRYCTEPNYISRCRLEELATLFKDKLLEIDDELAMEYFNEECEMTDEEKEFFGIETESEDDDFDDSPAWEDDSDRGCKDCPDDECTGHYMSCYYRSV